MCASNPEARSALAAAVITLLAGVQELRAGGFTVTVFGGRRTAMMANIARPDDLTALFHNPAGLADLDGVRVHLSATLTFVQTAFEVQALDPRRFITINPAGCGQPGRAPCPWPIDEDGYYRESIAPERSFGAVPFFAASYNLGRPSAYLGPLGIGLALYAPNFFGAALPEDAPTAFNIIDGAFVVLATTAGAGWRLNRWLAVGVNLAFNIVRMSFRQRISVIDALTPAGEQPSATALAGQSLLGDLELDYTGVDVGVGWGAALLVNPTPWLAIGVNYNGASTARPRGDVSFRALGPLGRDPSGLPQALAGFGLKLPQKLEVELPIPHSLQLGVNLEVFDWLEISADLRLWFYSVFERQTIRPIYDVGQPGAEPLSEASLSRQKNYRLSYELGGGVLVRPWHRRRGWLQTIELMAGLAYDRSPVPDSTFTLDNPALSLAQLGFGVRLSPTRSLRLALSYVLFVYIRRDITGSRTWPPTNVRGAGTAHLPGLEVEYRFR